MKSMSPLKSFNSYGSDSFSSSSQVYNFWPILFYYCTKPKSRSGDCRVTEFLRVRQGSCSGRHISSLDNKMPYGGIHTVLSVRPFPPHTRPEQRFNIRLFFHNFINQIHYSIYFSGDHMLLRISCCICF